MTDALNPTTATPIRLVDSHSACRLCGYDLHGLFVHGRCPECGADVAASLGDNLLVHADQKWLATLLSGVRALELGFVLTVLLVVVSLALNSSPFYNDARLTLFCMSLACIIAWCAAGGWMLSAPDPSGHGEREYGLARKIARWALILGAMQGLLDCAALSAQSQIGLIIDTIATETAIAQIIGVVGVVAHLHYLQMLLRRIPDHGMSARAQALKFVLGGLWALLYGITLLGIVNPISLPLGVTALMIGLLGLLNGFVYLVFLFRLERRLAAVLHRAKRTAETRDE